MDTMGFPEVVLDQDTSPRDAIKEYLRLRPTALRIHNLLAQNLSYDVLDQGAKRLGILRGGEIYLHGDGEAAAMMDYCIYNVYRNGRNAIDQYVSENAFDSDSDVAAVLKAMQHATYTLAVGVAIKPGIGGYIQNLLSNETRLLTDVAISETGRPGMVLATRLLDYGNYVTTGGASIPVGMISCDEMEEWQRAITLGRDSSGFDPADLIVTCLKGDPWSCSNFAELNRYVKTNIRRLSQKTELSQRKSALARRVNRASLNHRCKCGSGKMAKNCCGMRQAS